MTLNRSQIRLHKPEELRPVPIVADGGVATPGVADGRMIPVVIVDTTERPDIDDVVRAHTAFSPGDVDSVWFRPSRWSVDRVGLILDFKRPSECVAILEFETQRKGALIDAMVRAQGFYLQPGRPGQHLSDEFDNDRILIEVPSHFFRDAWETIFLKATIRRFKKSGLSRRESKERAAEAISRIREISSLRAPTD
jgi:hypothetical protein